MFICPLASLEIRLSSFYISLYMLWNSLSFLDAISICYFILSAFVFDFVIIFLFYFYFYFQNITIFLFLSFYLFTFVFIVLQNVMEGFRILDICLGKLQKVLECHMSHNIGANSQ